MSVLFYFVLFSDEYEENRRKIIQGIDQTISKLKEHRSNLNK